MATLADGLRQSLASIRGIPGALGLRPNAVSVVIRTWAGRVKDGGSYSDSTLTIAHANGQGPHVREVSTREIASSGGEFEQGDLVVGPITTAPTVGTVAGAYTADQIAPQIPPDQPNVEVIYIITGQDAGEYRRVTINRDKALHYTLVLRRSNRTP